MEVHAIAKSIRISPKKMRLVAEKINKMKPEEAIEVLGFIPNASASPMQKLIKSALANAKNNLGLDENGLSFKEIIISKGPVIKRFKPVARGRAHSILRRTSHIKVTIQGQKKDELKPKNNEQIKADESTKEKKNGSKS